MAVKESRMIGTYEMRKKPLGSGGMATVYLVSKDGKEYAAKVLHQHLMRDRRTVGRFKKEFEIGQKMKDNPAFVKMLELEKFDGTWTIIMEYVPGLTLQDVLAKLSTLSPKEATALIYELSKALHSFHLNNYIHRDLKPGNIMITPAGKVRIMDYGVTRDLDVNMTKTGTAVGTPLYMAPEQICGSKSTDCRCDLYSLGLIYFRLLSRKDAHGMTNNFEFMELVEARMKKPIRKIKGLEEADLIKVIEKSLQAAPDERFSSSADFCSAIEKLNSFSTRRTATIKNLLLTIEKNAKKKTTKVNIDKTVVQKKPKGLLFKLVLFSGLSAAIALAAAFTIMGPENFIKSIKGFFSQLF